ncbi:F0F1 ATP synthase subunit gamma [Sciscionella sediminilitoris]|uniref:F0F1 ATP synthase subunit gamma n=1 Tax=Sciscionella sediminilitoris TaxID=1445613 RepID=UPI0004DF290C|nr:F0F1 ATP synthase subunit gamma [Sciscionella sp. SE31]
MPAQLRVLRRRIRSAGSIKKITKAQELIATSRIARAQANVRAARPYAEEITRVLSALATASALKHPLLVERETPRRAGILVVTADRGLCGGYNANVLRQTEELISLLREQGKEPVLYAIGRRGVSYFNFRGRELAGQWTGFSEQPRYENASEVAETLVSAFTAGADDTAEGPGADGVLGVDELHIVYTEFKSMVSQVATAHRMAPLEVEYSEEEEPVENISYEFEPDPEELFDVLLPKYIGTRIFAALLESAASESASRQRAMKAATDNADELIRSLNLQANGARQAQITQEISEIVGGVDALAAAGDE